MTVEEIKEQHSMREVVEMYGFTVNPMGFIQCPFHTGDRTASLKVYKDSFHCFACETNGDIFKFVQLMENCDFKSAFLKLGGTYKQKKSFSDLRGIDKAKRMREERQKLSKVQAKRLKLVNNMIDILTRDINRQEEGSDEWHRLLDKREQYFYEYDQLIKEVLKK